MGNTPYVTGDWDGKYKEWKRWKVDHSKPAIPPKTLPPQIIEPAEEPASSIKPNKSFVILIGIILVLVILGIILYVNYDPSKIKYQPIDLEVRNLSGLPMQVYYNEERFLSLSGWESMLTINEKDRLFGNEQYKKIIFDDKGNAYTQIVLDNQVRLEPLSTDPTQATRIGWFTSLDNVKVEIDQNKVNKEVLVILENQQLNADLAYTLFKNKPYFTVSFSSNLNESGDFALGFVASGLNIYLPNGTILQNDNNITDIHQNLEVVVIGNVTPEANQALIQKVPSELLARKAVERKGTYSYLEDLEYEIFEKDGKGFIVFSDDGFNDFENMFQWNVFRIYLSPSNNEYPKVYFAIFENTVLNYNQESQTWNIENENFQGSIDEYINLVMEETWSSI